MPKSIKATFSVCFIAIIVSVFTIQTVEARCYPVGKKCIKQVTK